MGYCFITGDGNLIPLADFEVFEGQPEIVSIPVLGGTMYSQTRKGPDTFRMVAASVLPQSVGQFRVVGEDCIVYGCVGGNVLVENGRLVVTGVVHDKYPVEEQYKPAALQMMQGQFGETSDG